MNFSENWYTSSHWHKNNTGKVSWTTGDRFKRYEVLSPLLHSHLRNCSLGAKKVFYPFCMTEKQMDGQGNGPKNWLWTYFLMFSTSYSRKKHFRIVCEIFRTACEIFCSASQRHPKTVTVTPEQLASSIGSLRNPKAVSFTPKQSVSPL